MSPLIDREEYSALCGCTYLNQASLGLIPRTSLEASTRFLTEVAQRNHDSQVRDHASRLAADLAEQTAPLGWTPYRPLRDAAVTRTQQPGSARSQPDHLRSGRDGAGAPGGPSKARARRGERRTRRRAAAPLDPIRLDSATQRAGDTSGSAGAGANAELRLSCPA